MDVLGDMAGALRFVLDKSRQSTADYLCLDYCTRIRIGMLHLHIKMLEYASLDVRL